MVNYKLKFLKYKKKYEKLNQIGGMDASLEEKIENYLENSDFRIYIIELMLQGMSYEEAFSHAQIKQNLDFKIYITELMFQGMTLEDAFSNAIEKFSNISIETANSIYTILREDKEIEEENLKIKNAILLLELVDIEIEKLNKRKQQELEKKELERVKQEQARELRILLEAKENEHKALETAENNLARLKEERNRRREEMFENMSDEQKAILEKVEIEAKETQSERGDKSNRTVAREAAMIAVKEARVEYEAEKARKEAAAEGLEKLRNENNE